MQTWLPLAFATKGTKWNIYEFIISKNGNVYKFEEILHVHEKIQEGLEIRSTNNGSTW